MLDQKCREGSVDSQLTAPQKVAALLARHEPGSSLPQEFYVDQQLYEFEIENVLLKHWHCVGHHSQIREPGEYLIYEFEKESVIVIRGKDGKIRALSNVCRHRGSRICDRAGKAQGGMLVCPYHAWSYGLDGTLEYARMMPRHFDKKSHGLHQLPVHTIQGLILVSFSDDPLGLDAAKETVNGIFGPYDWENAKVIHQTSLTFDANWKLALENQVECLHCGPAHPEFCELHTQGMPNEAKLREELEQRTDALGLKFMIKDLWGKKAPTGQEMTYSYRVPMVPGVVTASKDGQPVAPLMGKLSEFDGGYCNFYVGPHNHFISYSDYGAAFCYTPRSANKTALNVFWLVRDDAIEGRDFERDRVTWLWDVTATADKKIVEDNQLGVGSRFYRPGPYSESSEHKTIQFIDWYLDALKRSAADNV